MAAALPRSTFRSVTPRLLACLLAASVIAPSAAQAGSGTKVVADCADDSRLSKKYSPAEYADALKNIPTDVDEYTDCRDVIKRAQLGLGGTSSGDGSDSGGTGGGGTAGGSGGSGDTGGGSGLDSFDAALATATPQERASIDKVKGRSGSVLVAGSALRPDALSDGELGTLNTLPFPLVIVLLLMALGTVTALVPKVRSLVRARAQPTA